MSGPIVVVPHERHRAVQRPKDCTDKQRWPVRMDDSNAGSLHVLREALECCKVEPSGTAQMQAPHTFVQPGFEDATPPGHADVRFESISRKRIGDGNDHAFHAAGIERIYDLQNGDAAHP